MNRGITALPLSLPRPSTFHVERNGMGGGGGPIFAMYIDIARVLIYSGEHAQFKKRVSVETGYCKRSDDAKRGMHVKSSGMFTTLRKILIWRLHSQRKLRAKLGISRAKNPL